MVTRAPRRDGSAAARESQEGRVRALVLRDAAEWLLRDELGMFQTLTAHEVIESLRAELVKVAEAPSAKRDDPAELDERDHAMVELARSAPQSLNSWHRELKRRRLSGGRRDLGARRDRLAALGMISRARGGRGGGRWIAPAKPAT